MSAAPTHAAHLRQTAILATLRRSQMFADLAAEDLAAVAAACQTRRLAKGEVLFREGEKATGFYVVQSGQISVHRITPDGRERIICVFAAPESFAEVVLATAETYPANAAALVPSQVICVDKARFRDLIRTHPGLALHMLASMSLHLKHLVQSLDDLKGRQIDERLAAWILKHVKPAKTGATASFKLPMSKRVLAGQLGVTSETLSRTFARFREAGALRVEGTTLHVLDLARLQSWSASPLDAR
jgi:CRP/FNR family transcriptional regulator, dissimilatory nitrate respiration regulator